MYHGAVSKIIVFDFRQMLACLHRRVLIIYQGLIYFIAWVKLKAHFPLESISKILKHCILK